MSSLDEKRLTSSTPPPVFSTISSSEHLPRSTGPNAPVEKNIAPETFADDFDPWQNAKPCSPFFNHDTPRGSMDNLKPRPSLHVSVYDLEAQNGLTPSQTADVRSSPGDAGMLKHWTKGASKFGRDKSRCSTKPKPRGCHCLSNLPKRQRLLIKLLIALVIIGAMVGVAVGISLRVGGGVYKNQNTTSTIGSV